MRPRLLDLFCGAGGAAMGYHRAGFDVVGVDINPQPRFPFEFHQADALTFPLDGFNAIHASPPCQRYSVASNIHGTSGNHPDLIPPTRRRLEDNGKPWVMENVVRSNLTPTLMLCGSMFGLGVMRHRLFESNHLILQPPCGSHRQWYASVFGARCVGRSWVVRNPAPGHRKQDFDRFPDELATARRAMGIDWMTLPELSEAIPPAYTEHIGAQLLAHIAEAAA